MRIQFTETEYGVDFHCTPETMEEVNQLFRMVNNARKSKSSSAYLSFAFKQPEATFSMLKVSKQNQVNSVSK